MLDDLDLISPDLMVPGDRTPIVIPAGPCESCHWNEACAQQSLACRIFLHFVSKGTIIAGRRCPNRGTYIRLFGPATECGGQTSNSDTTLDWIDDLFDPEANRCTDL